MRACQPLPTSTTGVSGTALSGRSSGGCRRQPQHATKPGRPARRRLKGLAMGSQLLAPLACASSSSSGSSHGGCHRSSSGHSCPPRERRPRAVQSRLLLGKSWGSCRPRSNSRANSSSSPRSIRSGSSSRGQMVGGRGCRSRLRKLQSCLSPRLPRRCCSGRQMLLLVHQGRRASLRASDSRQASPAQPQQAQHHPMQQQQSQQQQQRQ